MAGLTRDDLRERLRRHELDPVYVLYGTETYLRDVAAKTICDRAFSDGDLRDFNETSFSLNADGNLQKAFAAAEQLPMMAKRRVVRITDLRISATGYRDTITEDHEVALSAYLKSPAPDSVVVMIADELNGVRKMGKFLRSSGFAFEFKPLDDRELADWARRELAGLGAKMDEPMLRLLISRVGPDVRRLTNEINKLAAAAMPAGLITFELIESLVPHSRELSNFDLTDHLVAGRRSAAMSVMRKILDDGGEPLMLLGLISYNYRRLLMAKDMMSRGVDRSQVARALKLRYSDQEGFLATARRADEKALTQAIRRLAKTDLAIKTSLGGSGPAGARMQLEVLVCELALI